MPLFLLKLKNEIFMLKTKFLILKSQGNNLPTLKARLQKKIPPILLICIILMAGTYLTVEVLPLLKKTMKQQLGIGGPPLYKTQLYTIKEKESLWQIAKKNHLAFDTVVTANKMKSVHMIRPGQELYLPNQDGVLYTIKPGETIFTVSEKFKVSMEDLLDVNDLSLSCTNDVLENKDIFIPGAKLSSDERIGIMGMNFFKPANGKIRSGFGWRKDPFTQKRQYHTGVDFACSVGTPIKAAADGQVLFAGNRGGYGIAVILRHRAGYTTLYGHLSKPLVLTGQFVKAGQTIAKSGNTGRSTGPHLHFEVRKYGIPVNPLDVAYFFAKK